MAGNLVRPKNVTDAQWQQAVELYNAAKRKGDRYPEITVAQAALETGWFKSPSGKYNYFGQKAKASEIAVIFSEDAHYSVFKGANLLGINPITVKVNFEDRKVLLEDLENKLKEAFDKGIRYLKRSGGRAVKRSCRCHCV